MECEIKSLEKVSILTMTGNMKTQKDYDAFKEAIDEILEFSQKEAVVNMDGVGYINSSGLGRLILTSKKMLEAGGSLKVCNLSDDLKELFSITRLNERIKIFDTEEEAIAST